MKQIQSIFLDDEEYDKLMAYKESKGYTWKELLLSIIKEGDKDEDK